MKTMAVENLKRKKVCSKCARSMDEYSKFFATKDGGKMDICKSCMTMHIDNYDPETFIWILKDLDIPFVAGEWNQLIEKFYIKKPGEELKGGDIIGKYISKMKLSNWKEFGFDDSEALAARVFKTKNGKAQDVETIEAENAALREKLVAGEISHAQYMTRLQNTPAGAASVAEMAVGNAVNIIGRPAAQNQFDDQNFLSEEELSAIDGELTSEDKIYLATKWGRLYKPNEWIEMERTYTEMMNSFDIQDADTANALILICKTDLKMNQAIDMRRLRRISKIIKSIR